MSSKHLSADQISGWIAGEQPSELGLHLEQCADCKSQVAEFHGVMSTFRQGLRHAVEVKRVPVFEAPAHNWPPASRWVLAGAMAACLAAVPFYRNRTQPEAVPPVVVSEVSDSALLEQVDMQLSRGVPGAMEPLAALVWNASDLQSARKGE